MSLDQSLTNSKLIALEANLPPNYLSSSELEEKLSPVYERLKLPQGRLEMMSGVETRGYWDVGTLPSDIAAKAASNLIEKNGINPQEIDLLIHSSVCRDFLEPSTASVVHHKLGLSEKCMIFDLSNACLGMLNAIYVASEMIERGSIKRALIVSGENSAPLIEETITFLNGNLDLTRKSIKKYFANLTIGSCGMAALIGEGSEDSTLASLEHAVCLTDSNAHQLCQGDGSPGSLMMETDSERLMQAGVKLAKRNWSLFLDESGRDPNDYQSVFCHQVGKAHESLTLQSLELNHLMTHQTYPFLGNTGSAALPVTLWDKHRKSPEELKGKVSALLGIGSGLTSIMMGLRWH